MKSEDNVARWHILAAKEERYAQQQLKLGASGVSVVQITLNLPGGFTMYPWEKLLTAARAEVHAMLADLGVELVSESRLVNALGPCHLMAVLADGHTLKQHCIALEETATQGRLWDIDVITRRGAVNRHSLGLKGRMCWVCEQEEAHVCRLLRAHAADEVIAIAKKIAVWGTCINDCAS